MPSSTESGSFLVMKLRYVYLNIYSFLASGSLCHLLITSANRLGPDQDRVNVGPDLDTLIAFLKDFF